MDLRAILKESFLVVRHNFTLIVPTIGVSFVMTLLALLLLGVNMATVEDPSAVTTTTSVKVSAFIIAILGFLLQAFSQGMTVAMASDAINKGSSSLKTAFSTAVSRIEALSVAGLLIGLLFAIGVMLFLIPGLIVAFIFMFTFVIVITEDIGAVEAMKKSYMVVRANLKESILLFLSLAGAAIAANIINRLFLYIPLLGQLATLVLMGGFFAFLSVSLLRSYTVLQTDVKPFPESTGRLNG